MAIPEELITFKEAQEYLGISKAKMGRLAKEGSLPIYADPLDKRKKLVPRAEVEKLKQPQAIKGKSPPPPPAPEKSKPAAPTKAEAKKPEVKTLVEAKAEIDKVIIEKVQKEVGDIDPPTASELEEWKKQNEGHDYPLHLYILNRWLVYRGIPIPKVNKVVDLIYPH